MLKINGDKIIYLSSGVDDAGKVFKFADKDSNIYRIINNKYSNFYSNFLSSPSIENLFKCGLIKTKQTNLKVTNGELIVKHELINYVNYPYEWSREMLKDAAIFFLTFNLELIKNGYFTKDAHSFNIIFVNNKLLFTDFTSIISNPLGIPNSWIVELYNSFIFPIMSFEIDNGKFYREKIIKNPVWIFTKKDLFKLFLNRYHVVKIYRFLLFILRYYIDVIIANFVKSKKSQIQYLLRLKKNISKMKILYPKSTWGNYYDTQKIVIQEKKTWNQKQYAICKIANILNINSVLDLGGNTGFYLDLIRNCNHNIKNTILFDSDEVCIDKAYLNRVKNKNIINLVVDFKNIGKDLVCVYNNKKITYESIDKRINADLVMVLALTHHLVFDQNYNFDYISYKLSLITKKYCIVEFVPKEDIYIKQWWTREKYPNYNLKSFKKSLEKYFKVEAIYNSFPEIRKILLCKKRRTYAKFKKNRSRL